jgi:hypothetical protein
MGFGPGVDIRRQPFRQLHGADRFTAGCRAADQVVRIFPGGVGHISGPPIDKPLVNCIFGLAI